MEILVVDPSSVVRSVIRDELEAGGYEIIEAADRTDALCLFQERDPALITLSVEMGERSGFELCESIRALETVANVGRQVESIVPVLFVTSNDTFQGRERGFAAGATDFVPKPFAPGELLRAVNAILNPEPLWHDLLALVADDSTLTRSVLSNALRRLGVQVLTASDGRAALALAKEHASQLVMIVADLLMPHLDGTELCRRVRADDRLRDVPFIAVSAAADREAVMRLFRAGATDYLLKPFSLEELLARIRVHLDACLLTRDLARRHHQMEADLELAKAVQEGAVHARAQVPGIRHALCSLPLEQVSGDVHDFSISHAGALNVFLGDATGHGLGAALMTMMVGTALDSIGPDAPIDATLTRLHHLVNERAGDRFVTGVYARLAPDGTVRYASAGHPPMILVPRTGPPRLLTCSAGLPLGLINEPLQFGVAEEQLAPGDRVYLYTDGIVEWSRADGEQYSLRRTVDFLGAQRDEPLEACVEGVIESARQFAQGAPAPDDVTVVGLQYC